ncbi:MAG: hypothetical protein NTZ17_14125 [Phycisphaerae bacterium]|nr:hypothetical protein [Phycisphaerae bacterium]
MARVSADGSFKPSVRREPIFFASGISRKFPDVSVAEPDEMVMREMAMDEIVMGEHIVANAGSREAS